MKEIWTEKYRPKLLKEVIGQAEITDRLSSYVTSKNIPHLLFTGAAGTGKTTCALALARELFGEDIWRQNFSELNASDERGIQVVRTKIKDFARTAPMGDLPFKIIFLDEADALTPEAQAALRRTMERFTHTCRFILSCNYSSKIIEPIQSRCAVFRFRKLADDAVKKHLQALAKNEKLKLNAKAYDAIIYIAEGDLRKATNALQVAATLGKDITEDTIYHSTATARPEEIEKLVKTALNGDFLGARSLLDELLTTYGLSGDDIISQIHKNIFNLSIPERSKVELVDTLGEIEFRLVEGSNERIQLETLLAHFVLVGSKHK
ncbi:MAG: replication factor C small subunit [Thermoplasmata archaeon]|nr:MAG: replication factor C small subunit [Thermoplasmata archaeon]